MENLILDPIRDVKCDVLIVKYGELWLKGQNRVEFESRLVRNIKKCCQLENIEMTFNRGRGQLEIRSHKTPQMLKWIFGAISYNPAISLSKSLCKDMDDLLSNLDSILQKINLLPNETFRVTVKRQDKGFKPSSNEIASIVGQKIAEKTKARVKLKDFGKEIVICITGKNIIFSWEEIKCAGGLPLGSQRRVVAIVSDIKDCLAAFFAMKRGCGIALAVDTSIDSVIDAKLVKYSHFIENIEKYHIGLPVVRLDYDVKSIQTYVRKMGILAVVYASEESRAMASELNLLNIEPLSGLNGQKINLLLDEIFPSLK